MSKKIKILHLEDSINDSELIRSLIVSGGIDFDYFLVENEKDYLRILEKENISIILSDFSMPNYSGKEALKVAREKYSNIPFVFVSGTIGEDAAISAMLNGATDYVLKNNIKRLVPAIIRAIHEHELEIKHTHALEELRESEEKFKIITENAPDAIFITNKEGKYLYVNKQAIDLLEYSKEELLSFTIADISPANRVEEYFQIFQRLFTEGISYSEIELVKKDGSHVQADLNAVLLPNGWIYGSCHDITERKRLKTNLSTATEIAKLGYWEFDVASGNFIFNEQYYKIIHGSSTEKQGGNAMSAAEFAGKLVHPDDSKMVAKELQEAINSNDPEYLGQAEARVFRDNGDITNVIVQFKVVKDDAGRTIKIIGINQDITEKKRVENELLEKEKKFRELFDNAPVGYHELDSEGRIAWINQTELDMFGYSEEEMIGQFVWNFRRDKETSKQRVFEKLKGIRPPSKGEERVYRRKDQTAFPSIVEEKILYDAADRIIGIRTTIQDITERKQAEKEITMLAHALESVKECVSITDLEDNIIFVNESFIKTYGYNKNELIGENIKIVRSQKNEAKLIGTILPHTLKGGWNNELWNKRKDGSEFLIYLSTTIIKDTKGNPLGLIGVASDITEQKNVENELIKAKEKAEESDRLKSAFLANMSHEIRTPMNGILGFTQLLKTPKLTGSEQQAFIDVIEKSGARMLNIINDIINISRIESGQVELSFTDVNINEMAIDIFKFFKPEAEKKELIFSYKNALLSNKEIIKTDKDKVFAILTNLVKNALKFTQKGSIELGYGKKDKFLEFFVKDTGIGIPQGQKEIIFERFRQGSESTIRNYEGAGLGLAISKAYVEMLGGKIWIESKVGQGSTFRFTIPYLNGIEEKEQIQPVAEKEILPIRKLKILVVDDDETSREFLKIMTAPLSSVCFQARTGNEAIEVCRKNPDIDLVLMDINMPEMNGYEATRQIRTFNKKVVIIAQTAYALVGDREKALEAGCNDHISKPITRTTLIKLIENKFRPENV